MSSLMISRRFIGFTETNDIGTKYRPTCSSTNRENVTRCQSCNRSGPDRFSLFPTDYNSARYDVKCFVVNSKKCNVMVFFVLQTLLFLINKIFNSHNVSLQSGDKNEISYEKDSFSLTVILP